MQMCAREVLPHGAWRCQLTRLSRCSSSLRIRWKVILTRDIGSLQARCQRATAHVMTPSWRSCKSFYSEIYRVQINSENRESALSRRPPASTACFFAYVSALDSGHPVACRSATVQAMITCDYTCGTVAHQSRGRGSNRLTPSRCCSLLGVGSSPPRSWW